MKYFLSLIVFISCSVFAGTKEYTVGTGSEFKFTGEKGESVNLSIYFTESSFTKLGVEYFFSTGILGTQVWQQYILGMNDKGLSLDAGYIQSSDMKKPEIMTKDFMDNNDHGVKVEDFFFSKESDIEKYKIGMETIEVPAGSMLTSHYQKKRDKQTVDFWISDKAGAIGLVKLVSQGTKDQNYKIELQSLLKNVKTKIDPKSAVPLSDKGKIFFGKIVD
jgi:hypothetical protein